MLHLFSPEFKEKERPFFVRSFVDQYLQIEYSCLKRTVDLWLGMKNDLL